MVGLHLHRSQVGRCLHQSFHILAHSHHAMRQRIDGLQQVAGSLTVDGRLAMLLCVKQHLQSRIRNGKLSLCLCAEDVERSAQKVLVFSRNGNHRMCSSSDGIAQVSAVYLAEHQVCLLRNLSQVATENLVGAGTLQVDVTSRVSAQQSLHLHASRVVIGRHRNLRVGPFAHRIHATSTSDEDLSLILRVEVQQDVGIQETRLEGKRSREACLLIAGEEALQRAVLYGVVCQDGQLCSHADAIVGSQGGTLSPQPVALYLGFDRIFHEVVLHLLTLITHHVHVALQSYRQFVLHARGGRLAHQHIATLVGMCLYAMLLSELL